uniref:Ubiquitin-like modifier-activating enzyme 5 n=2 Tax=Macrostomum lignano TaxID=282301 RepID=A0A1I8GZ54_9PLAT
MATTDANNVEQLRARVAKLESELAELRQAQPASLANESTECPPRSRLMALQRMGVVQNYERIREQAVLIVGVGGVGSVTAEMLTRCGVGRLILFDYDKVEMANMNRLFFQPHQAGLSKVEAAKRTLLSGCAGYELLRSRAAEGGLPDGGPVQTLLACVDNYEARVAVSAMCTELGLTWLESGVSEDAVSGHVQLMRPGRTLSDERTLSARRWVVAATLKLLLGFGRVSPYLGYSAMTDFFPVESLKPNPDCAEPACQRRQREAAEADAVAAAAATPDSAEQNSSAAAAAVHSENDWCIELVEEGGDEAAAGRSVGAGGGVRTAYSVPAAAADAAAPAAASRIEFPPVEEIQRQCHELEALLDGEGDGDESGSAKRRDRPCPLCGRQFRLLANLRRHLRLRHALLHRQESPEQPPRKRSRPTGPAKKPGWAGASGEWRSAEVASHAELTAWRLSHEASVGCRYYVSSLRREGGGGEPGAVRYCVHSCSAGWRTRLACPARIIASRRPGGLAGYRIRYSLLHRHHPEHRPPARTRFSAGEASHVPDVRARALRSALLSTEEPDRLCDPRLARRLTREALRGHALGGQQPWQAVEERLLTELAAGPASPLLLCQFRRSWCFRNRVRLGAGFHPSDGALGCALTLQAPSERQLLAQRLSSAEALVIDCVYESSDPEELSVLCLLLLDAEGRPQTGGWLLTDRVTETRVEDWLRCCVTAAADSPRSDSGCAFTGWLLLPPGLLGATAGARVFPRAAGCFAERLQLLRSWRRCLQARPDQWDVAALLLLELHAAAVQPQLGRASAALSEFARKFRRVSPELAARADRLARWPQLWADAAKPARLRWVEMRLHSNPGLLGLLPLHFAGRTRRPDRLLA